MAKKSVDEIWRELNARPTAPRSRTTGVTGFGIPGITSQTRVVAGGGGGGGGGGGKDRQAAAPTPEDVAARSDTQQLRPPPPPPYDPAQAGEELQAYLATMQRTINCLTDADRSTRKGALQTLHTKVMRGDAATPQASAQVLQVRRGRPRSRPAACNTACVPAAVTWMQRPCSSSPARPARPLTTRAGLCGGGGLPAGARHRPPAAPPGHHDQRSRGALPHPGAAAAAGCGAPHERRGTAAAGARAAAGSAHGTHAGEPTRAHPRLREWEGAAGGSLVPAPSTACCHQMPGGQVCTRHLRSRRPPARALRCRLPSSPHGLLPCPQAVEPSEEARLQLVDLAQLLLRQADARSACDGAWGAWCRLERRGEGPHAGRLQRPTPPPRRARPPPPCCRPLRACLEDLASMLCRCQEDSFHEVKKGGCTALAALAAKAGPALEPHAERLVQVCALASRGAWGGGGRRGAERLQHSRRNSLQPCLHAASRHVWFERACSPPPPGHQRLAASGAPCGCSPRPRPAAGPAAQRLARPFARAPGHGGGPGCAGGGGHARGAGGQAGGQGMEAGAQLQALSQ